MKTSLFILFSIMAWPTISLADNFNYNPYDTKVISDPTTKYTNTYSGDQSGSYLNKDSQLYDSKGSYKATQPVAAPAEEVHDNILPTNNSTDVLKKK